MIRILTSDFKNYKKTEEKKITLPMDNGNGIVTQLKKYLNKTKKVVFIASDVNNTHELVSSYANIFFDSMKMIGITFDEYYILDGKSKDKAREYIEESDLVFLCGGDTYKQHVFFEMINLKSLLENYNGIVMGQSAGALNMAEKVFNSPEEQEKSQPIYFDGLRLTDINIEPHFVYDVSNFDDNEKYQRNAIINESYNRPIYGQCNGSYIIIDNENNVKVYGQTYLIYNGNIECICKEGRNILINETSNIKKTYRK